MKKAVVSKTVASKKPVAKNQVVNKNVITKKDLDKKFEVLSKIPQTGIELQPRIENSIQISYNFEAFEQVKTLGKRSLNPVITVYNNGIFSINRVFMQELKELGDFTHVKLFYDKSSKSIGLSFKSHANDGCLHKIATSKSNNYQRFSSKAFFIYYGLDLEKIKGKYEPKKTYINKEIGDVWVLDLKKHA